MIRSLRQPTPQERPVGVVYPAPGAAACRGHLLPGVLVGSEIRRLPPGVEQAPERTAAAAAIRQRLLATADDAAPATRSTPTESATRRVDQA